LLPPACGLLLLPLALARRSRALLLATLLVVLAGGVTSCTESNVISGGTLARSGSNTTPAATYQVTVDVLSNNVKHTVTLTLIVD
jgi:hypothetical protein